MWDVVDNFRQFFKNCLNLPCFGKKWMKNVLAETKRVARHKDGTFSFISNSKKIRIELNKAGISCVGGLNELENFVEEIEQGKRKVKISKKAIKTLRAVIIATGLKECVRNNEEG